MKKPERNEGFNIDDIPTAIAAGYYGVPKSLIFGYFIEKFFDGREKKARRLALENYLNNYKWGRTREYLNALEAYESAFGTFEKSMQPVNTSGSTTQNLAYENPKDDTHSHGEKISLMLCIGIFFMPYIFSWFTLNGRYGKKAKVISFIWMAFVLLKFSADIIKRL
jgi:hypothetical protein